MRVLPNRKEDKTSHLVLQEEDVQEVLLLSYKLIIDFCRCRENDAYPFNGATNINKSDIPQELAKMNRLVTCVCVTITL